MNESTFAFYWLGIAFGIAFGFPMAQFIVWVCKLPARAIVLAWNHATHKGVP